MQEKAGVPCTFGNARFFVCAQQSAFGIFHKNPVIELAKGIEKTGSFHIVFFVERRYNYHKLG
jgi:hypothetical protein